jgi:Ca2+-binding RTX toxin-like protein
VLTTLLAISWLSPARAQTTDPHVHLVWANTGDAADPCHTGDAFETVVPPATATALACVLSSNEAPVDTSTSDLTLAWSVEGPATFTASPSADTDQSGTATAELYVPDDGTSEVQISLCSDPACTTVLSTDTATLVTTPGPDPTECNDGIDNDQDGTTDYPDDSDCSSPNDESENQGSPMPPPTPAGCQGFKNVIVGTDGADVLVGTDVRDCIYGAGGEDIIKGRGHDDLLIGGAMNDTILGNSGADVLRGSKGGDELRGGLGDDRLSGNDGNDELNGGRGYDTARGGPGKDSCTGERAYLCES